MARTHLSFAETRRGQSMVSSKLLASFTSGIALVAVLAIVTQSMPRCVSMAAGF